MLLTNLSQVKPGACVGATVMHPRACDVCLLKPGVDLTEAIIERLRALGVRQIWIEHDLTRDLDAAVGARLCRVRNAVYNSLKQDVRKLQRRTITKSQVRTYRRAVIHLIRELVAHRAFASLTDQLYDADNELVSHGSNVAYLATLVGLELQTYLVRERPRLVAWRARDLVNLGLGAMLHDVGKVRLDPQVRRRHEALAPEPPPETTEYGRHPEVGCEMLQSVDVSATVRHVVLSHHRRFNGSGWPDLVRVSKGAVRKQPAGRKLHVFTRIVSAVNVLDNLLRNAEGTARPPVAALYDFAGPRFDAWFDPIVRMAALRRLPPFAVGSEVGLCDGRTAVVTAPNVIQPCRPTVRILNVSSGEPETVDLANHPGLSVATWAGTDVRKWLFELSPPAPQEAAEPGAAEAA